MARISRPIPIPQRREQIISAYASFARYLVGRVALRTATLSEEDLLGQALIGLPRGRQTATIPSRA